MNEKRCGNCKKQVREIDRTWCPVLECKNKSHWEPKQDPAKADNGKPRLTLVPPSLIKSVAAIREYGCQKYGSDDNWKLVEPQRYRDALYRHWLAYLEGEVDDPESGLPHLWHIATNIAFLIEMEGENK